MVRFRSCSAVGRFLTHHCPTVIGQCADRRLLVVSHKATVTRYVGTEDGGEFAFEVLGGHGTSPFLREWFSTTDGQS